MNTLQATNASKSTTNDPAEYSRTVLSRALSFAWLPLIFLGGVLVMTAYEVLKQLIVPEISLWQSHVITVIFGALLATATAHFVFARDKHFQERLLQEIAERERMGETLRQDKEFTRILLDSLEDGVVACDAEGELMSFNRTAREWHGIDALRLPPENWAERYGLYSPDGVTPLPTEAIALLRAFKGETVREAEMVIRAPGCSPRHVVVNGGPFFDEQGKKLGAVATMHDVTERKQAEEALTQEQHLMQTLMDSTPDTIYFKDKQGRFIRISNSQAEILGASSVGQAIGKTDFDFFGLEHAQAACDDELEIMRTGHSIVNLEEELDWPDRPSRWVSSTKMPLRDQAGNIIGTFGISRDITARKRAEQTLDYERYLSQSLMDSIPDSIYFKDLQSRFIRVNAPAARLVSLAPEQVIGKTDFDFFAPEYAQATYETEQEIIRTGQPVMSLEQLETAPGKAPRWVSATKMPLRDKAGNIIGTFGITRDVTARKRAEDQLLYLSTHDALTGLYNRTFFEEVLAHVGHGNPFPISIVIVDIDGMKHTNDTHGHPAGDELLRRTASVLQAIVREDDVVARIGGDEFAILLPRTDNAEVESILNRLKQGLAEHNSSYDGLPLSFSMGAATAYEHGLLTQTISVADRQMYRDKQQHRYQLDQPS